MADPYAGFSSLTSQGESWATVVPSDTVDFPIKPKSLICTVAGNVALVGSNGVVVVFPVTAGQCLNLRPVRVNATSTTATVVAIY